MTRNNRKSLLVLRSCNLPSRLELPRITKNHVKWLVAMGIWFALVVITVVVCSTVAF